MSWEKVRKRNGELEDFSPAKITKAIYKALAACGKESEEEAENSLAKFKTFTGAGQIIYT